MDGEKIWHELQNSLTASEKARFHRVNLKFRGLEPAIDDLSGMQALEAQTEKEIILNDGLRPTLESILASSFYFELDGLPKPDNGAYTCSGHVFCRLPLQRQG